MRVLCAKEVEAISAGENEILFGVAATTMVFVSFYYGKEVGAISCLLAGMLGAGLGATPFAATLGCGLGLFAVIFQNVDRG